jgi:hypothetical protein
MRPTDKSEGLQKLRKYSYMRMVTSSYKPYLAQFMKNKLPTITK